VAVPSVIGVLVGAAAALGVGIAVGKIAAVAVGKTRVAVGAGNCVGGGVADSTVKVVEARVTSSTLTVRATRPTAMSDGSDSVIGVPSHALP